MLNITKGKISRAMKVVVYGSEGIGKTTFASKFPEPLFIDTEGGTAHMDVRRIDRPKSWDELLGIIREVAASPDVCKTLVLDTADWAESLCADYICNQYKQNSIESFGYGKGYTYLAEEFGRLLSAMDKVIASGKNVVITAHAKMRKFEQPDEQGAYDRWEMKLSKQVAPLIKEWCDMLLFLNYRTYVVTSETNTKKATGGKRVMYTSHHPCWDAKNRFGLPDEMNMDFAGIAHLFSKAERASVQSDVIASSANGAALSMAEPQQATQISTATTSLTESQTTSPLKQLRSLMAEDYVTEAELQKVVAAKGKYPADVPITDYPEKFIIGWVIKYWQQIVDMVNDDRAVALD